MLTKNPAKDATLLKTFISTTPAGATNMLSINILFRLNSIAIVIDANIITMTMTISITITMTMTTVK